MKRRNFNKISGALLLYSILPNLAHAQNAENSGNEMFGNWFGVLTAGSSTLNLRLEIIDGKTANLYSINQGNGKIPANKFAIKGNEIDAKFAVIGASYHGTLSDGKIAGKFTQGAELELIFTRNNQTVKAEFAPLTQEGIDQARLDAAAPALMAIAATKEEKPKLFLSGFRAEGSDIKVEETDRWHIGSITKSFTALLIGKLVDDGILDWDESIAQTFGNYIKVPEPYENATLLHLLSHHAGLQANLPLEYLVKAKTDTAPIINQRRDFVRLALAQEPTSLVGQKFLYSNNGFVIAGHIAEFKSGKSWEDLVQEYIFKPLEIKNVGFGSPGTKGKIDEPLGHYANPLTGKLVAVYGGNATGDNPKVLGPAGTINIAPIDMMKYLKARSERNNIVSLRTWEKLETPPFGGNYALGVIKKDDGAIWHNGSNTLWYAEMIYYPDRGKYAFSATNSGVLDKVTAPVGKTLMMSLKTV